MPRPTKTKTIKTTANPQRVAYDYERDFVEPVDTAITKYMEHKGSRVRNGRYVNQSDDCLGCLTVPLTLRAHGEISVEPVNCALFVVFSSSLAKILEQVVKFGGDNYRSALEFVEEKMREQAVKVESEPRPWTEIVKRRVTTPDRSRPSHPDHDPLEHDQIGPDDEGDQ